MLAMRRESDQIFGSTSSAINNSAIGGTNEGVNDNCCNNNSFHECKCLSNFWLRLKVVPPEDIKPIYI